MAALTELVGDALLKHVDGKVIHVSATDALAGKKHVLFYFSAHWCGPCRKFTPLLSVLYEDRADKDEVEIIFVSNDADEHRFDEYFGEMPWLAIPFDNDAVRDALSEKFSVMGVPHVVVVSGADATVENDDARTLITSKKTLTGIF